MLEHDEFTPGKPIRTYNQDGQWRDWSTDELVGNRMNYLKNWKCGAGVENLFIIVFESLKTG